MLTNETRGASTETISLDGVLMPINHQGQVPRLEEDVLAALSSELEHSRYTHISSYRSVANRSGSTQTVRGIVRSIFLGYVGINDRLSNLIDRGLFATPNFDTDLETGAVVQVPGIRLYTVQDETAEA